MPDSNFYYKNNRLQQLRGFCYTMRYGTLTKAADVMGLTHATVSLQIKTLEEDLGIKLFEREGPRLLPTMAANMLIDEASTHIEAIDTLLERVKSVHTQRKRQDLKIGGNHATITYLYPHLVKQFLEVYPDVHISIAYYEQEDGIRALAQGEIECYMLPRRVQSPFGSEVAYEPLFFFKPVLLSLPDHPLAGKKDLTLEQIARHDCIAPPPEMAVVPGLYERLMHYDRSKRFRISFKNWEMTRKYVEAGIAVVVTLDILCEPNDMLVATPVSHIFSSGDYGVLTVKGREMSSYASHFLDMARQHSGKIAA